jgi:error-prone DNA polymerase
VYDAIIKRFGTERTAVTGMPETYRARHALRDAGLALGIPPQVVGEIAKSLATMEAARSTMRAYWSLPTPVHVPVRAGKGSTACLRCVGPDPSGVARPPG